MNEETFKEAAGPYTATLKENGHNYNYLEVYAKSHQARKQQS